MKNPLVGMSLLIRSAGRLAVVSACDPLAVPLSGAWAAHATAAAGDFTVVAGGAVTCTNSSIAGDVGTGTVVTQTGCAVPGSVHQGDAAAAYADSLTAYAALATVPCGQTLTGTLAGVTLAPGVHCFDAAATLTGTLTLQGSANGTWLFKVGTLGTRVLTGTNFNVVMGGGATPCNATWWVAQAATLTTSNCIGKILAGSDSTVIGGTSYGDVFAGGAGSVAVPTGTVTLAGATVAGCAGTA